MTIIQKDNIWATVVAYLKGRAVKLALKKILGSAVAGGFKAWLIKFAVEELVDEVGIPVVNAGIVEVKFYFDKKNGEKVSIKIEKARESGSDEDYDNAVDELYDS
tara:strand:- start:3505 stop:3819 length:315 start_codon:yes stop_codon:yes gene_type:complete